MDKKTNNIQRTSGANKTTQAEIDGTKNFKGQSVSFLKRFKEWLRDIPLLRGLFENYSSAMWI